MHNYYPSRSPIFNHLIHPGYGRITVREFSFGIQGQIDLVLFDGL